MRNFALVALCAVIVFASCKPPYQKGEQGLEYKIVGGGSGEKIKQGDFVQMFVGQYYNNGKKDSLLSDGRNTTGAVINPIDSAQMGFYYKVFSQLRKGDSLVMRMLTDSLFKDSPMGMPPGVQKGHYMITTIKVVDIFKTEAQAMAADEKERERMDKYLEAQAAEQIKKDDVLIQDYLKKNNINARKSPLGTYVEIIKPGTGPLIDTNVVVKTNYTGRLMKNNKTFDSNTDTAFKHPFPFLVNMTSDPKLGGSIIRGWSDGLKMLNEGAEARFYIPSALAYGMRGAGEDIGPNENLIFDVAVTDVLSRTEAMKEVEKQMEESRKMQQHFMDSLSKASVADTSAAVR